MYSFTGHPDYVKARFISSLSLLCVCAVRVSRLRSQTVLCVDLLRSPHSITAKCSPMDGSLYNTECREKTSRHDGWVMGFNNGQICNHFLKCMRLASVSVLPSRALLLTCFNPWSADETIRVMMLFHYSYNWWHVLLFIWHGNEHKWCLVDPDFSGIMWPI